MRLISSYSFRPWQDQHIHWGDKLTFVVLAKQSIERHAEIYGTVPILYTDSIGAQFFSALTDQVEIINCLDNVYEDNNVDPKVYSFAKMYVYGLQTEPFYFFDFDLYPKQAIDFASLDVDIITYALESVVDSNTWTRAIWEQHTEGKQLTVSDQMSIDAGLLTFHSGSNGNSMAYIEHVDHIAEKGVYLEPVFYTDQLSTIPAFNTSIFYCRDMSFVQEYVAGVLEMLRRNRDISHRFELTPVMPCEQQYMSLLAHSKSLTHMTVVDNLNAVYDEDDMLGLRHLVYCNNYYNNYLGVYAKSPDALTQQLNEKYSDSRCQTALELLQGLL